MKAGDIIFVRGKSPISNLVSYFDNGDKWSHVAIAVSDTHIFEAEWYTKATIREFHYDSQKYEYEIIDLGLTEEEREIVVHESIQLTGKWYDYKSILWYVLKRFFNLKGKNKFNNPDMLICSEALYILLLKINKINSSHGLSIDVTPNELYKSMTHLRKTY